MQDLTAIYKFTYKKKQILPKVDYIYERDDEEYFYYQLKASNYISLRTLLNLYKSQYVRLSIGQCLILIQLIYQKVIDVYNREKKNLSLITLDNIWIYTEKGFCGEMKPQETMKIIFLNYQDEDESLEQNLKQLSLVNQEIKTFCRKTEFKIRAKDGKNSTLIQQITNVIDEMFYEVEICLYENPSQIQQKINEYVKIDQETDYEYLQEDVSYIKKRYEKIVQDLNEKFKENCQNELQLNKKLLTWQKLLYDSFIEFNWERESYEIAFETIEQFIYQLQTLTQLNEEQRINLEHEFHLKLEEEGFFNFNSQKIRQAQKIKFQRALKHKLKSSQPAKDSINQLFEQLVEKAKSSTRDQLSFNEKASIREQNLKYIKDFYKQNAQNTYKLYDKFYFTINLQRQWMDKILNEILPDIDLNDQELQKRVIPEFQKLLSLNKMGINNEEKKLKYI